MAKYTRLLVTHVRKLKKKRFGRLTTRSLALGGLLGDLSFIYEHLPAHTELPRIHHRRTGELVYCARGSMTAYLGKNKFRITPGSLIVIPPGVRHKFVTAGRSCEAISLFHPGLSIGPGADIRLEA